MSNSKKDNMWNLTFYELLKAPQAVIEDDTEIVVSSNAIGMEFRCPICLDLLKKTMVAKDCLHRCCYECITTALRTGNKECPTCRKKIVSRRCLRPDSNLDQLISKLFPDKIDHKQMDTATTSSSSENILQGNMGNPLNTCDEEVSVNLDVNCQTGSTTSLNADVNPEDNISKISKESEMDKQTTTSGCINSDDTETEETEAPRINEQLYTTSTLADFGCTSADNINLSSQNCPDAQCLPSVPLSLASSSNDNKYSNTDSDQIAGLSTSKNLKLSHQNSKENDSSNKHLHNQLLEDFYESTASTSCENAEEIELGDDIFIVSISSDESSISPPLNLNFVEDKLSKQPEQALSSEKNTVTKSEPYEDNIRNKLSETITSSFPTSDISIDLLNLASSSNQTTPLQTMKLEEERISQTKSIQRSYQKLVDTSPTNSTTFEYYQPLTSKSSDPKNNMTESSTKDNLKAFCLETNNELLQKSSIPTEKPRKKKCYKANITFKKRNTKKIGQGKRNTLSMKKKLLKSRSQSNKDEASTSCIVDVTKAHTSNLDQSSEETTVKKQKKIKKAISKHIELILKLRPSKMQYNNQIYKVLHTNSIRFLKTTENATVDHLGKYLITTLIDVLDKQTLETCELSQFCYYVWSPLKSYIQLDVNQTLCQVSNYRKMKQPLEIYYSYNP